MNKKGFSFVEIIIVITIVALLAVIGATINSGYQQKAMNSKILSDLETIKGGLSLFKTENKSLPLPLGNINFYGTSGEYMHSQSGAYGVYGSLRENILSKKYLTNIPVDPRTNQYYKYGKTIETQEFEIAGIISENGVFTSRVFGDYTGKKGPKNLIREYNGTNFVFDSSLDIFPYNPEEKAMNARILSNSGAVSVNGITLSDENILSTILVSGDTIQVGTGSTAQIGFSDGSISTLGDASSSSEIILAYLDYKDDSFFTKISIALKIGTIWTQATKLENESEFQIYTSDTTASVRGTIFGVSKKPSGETQVTVTVGKVLVSKIQPSENTSTFEKLVETVSNEETIELSPINSPGVTTSGTENGQTVSYIEVPEGTNPLGIDILPSGTITTTPIQQPINEITLGNGISLEVKDIERNPDGRLLFVSIKNNTRFKRTDKIIINGGDFATAQNIENFFYGSELIKFYAPTSGDFKQFSLQVCRTPQLCTRILTLPIFTSTDDGTKDEETSMTCNGIKISGNCLQNNLSASGYTLVAAADYTKKEDDLYTYNGGRIDGNYSGTGLTDDGYRPSTITGTGIVYNLATIVDEKDFVIEMEVDGEGFNSTGSQYLVYKSGSLAIWYNGNYKKLFLLSNPSDNVLDTNNIQTGKKYTIRTEYSSFKKAITILNTNEQMVYHYDFPINDILSPLEGIIIGRKSTGISWKSYIKEVKFYQRTNKITSLDINNLNQVSIKKPSLGGHIFNETGETPMNGTCGTPITGLREGGFSRIDDISYSEMCQQGDVINLINAGYGYDAIRWQCKGENGGTDSNICTTNIFMNREGCGQCPSGYTEVGGFLEGYPKICNNVYKSRDKSMIVDYCRRYGDNKDWLGYPIPTYTPGGTPIRVNDFGGRTIQINDQISQMETMQLQ